MSKTAFFNKDTGEYHTPKGRFVWPTFLEPRKMKGVENAKPRFGGTLLLPKGSVLTVLIEGVATAGKEKFGAQWQTKAKFLPIGKTAEHDKLKEFAEEFPAYIKAASGADYPPFIFGSNHKPFSGDASEIYSGRWGAIAGTFYGYDNVSKGVNFSLNRVLLLDHDEPIAGGRVNTAAGFEAFDVSDDGPMGGSVQPGTGTDGASWDPMA